MKKFRENILLNGSCFLVFILPLLYFSNRVFPHLSSKVFFFYGFVEILSALWIYTLIVNPTYRLPKRNLLYFIPLIGFLVWMTISGILAVNPELSFWSSLVHGTGLITLYHSILFAFIIGSLVNKLGMSYVSRFMQWFITGAFILAISVWLGNFNMPYQSLQEGGGGGLIGNSSLSATYMMFALAFGAFLFTLKTTSRSKKWWIVIAMAVMIFSPDLIDISGFLSGKGFLQGARGALLGIIIGVGVCGVGYLALSKKKIIRILGISAIVLGFVVFSFAWRQLVTPDTFLHQKFSEVATGGNRFIFWDEAQKAIDEHPWFGYGPENYMIAFQHYLNPKMFTKEYNHEAYTDRAHNIYYDTGVSGGYPAIILYSFFIISILYVLYKLWRIGVMSRIQISIFWGFIIGYLFQNLFVFDSLLSIMALFSFIGIVFFLKEDIPKKGKVVYKPVNPIIKNTMIFLLITGCSISWFFFAYMPAQKVIAYARVFATPQDKPFNELLGGSTVGEQWDVSVLAQNTYNSVISDATQIKSDPQSLSAIKKDIDNFLKYLEVLTEKNSTDDRLYINMGYLYSTQIYLTGQAYDKVETEHILGLLDRARSISPTNLEAYWVTAQIDAWSGDLKGAEIAYRQAIAIDPSVPPSHDMLISFARTIMNKKMYDDALIEAQRDIPGYKFNN